MQTEEFDRLMERVCTEFRAKMFRYIRSRVAPADAEDVLSCGLVKIGQGLPSYDERKGSLSTWVYAVTRNVVTDHFRARRPCAPEENALICDELEEVVRREERRELADALAHLPQREHALIVLHYYAGRTLREIARRFGTSYSTIKRLHAAVLSRLRAYLSPSL